MDRARSRPDAESRETSLRRPIAALGQFPGPAPRGTTSNLASRLTRATADDCLRLARILCPVAPGDGHGHLRSRIRFSGRPVRRPQWPGLINSPFTIFTMAGPAERPPSPSPGLTGSGVQALGADAVKFAFQDVAVAGEAGVLQSHNTTGFSFFHVLSSLRFCAPSVAEGDGFVNPSTKFPIIQILCKEYPICKISLI